LLAWSTRKAALAAEDAARVAQEQLKHARYPLVMPVVTAEIPATGPAGDPDRSRLAIPLVNVGTGPALDVVITLSAEAHIEQELIQQPALAVSATCVVDLNTFNAPGAPDFDLAITYLDVAGDSYRVTAHWNTAEHRYDGIRVLEE